MRRLVLVVAVRALESLAPILLCLFGMHEYGSAGSINSDDLPLGPST